VLHTNDAVNNLDKTLLTLTATARPSSRTTRW
jgi:hypothetical protein